MIRRAFEQGWGFALTKTFSLDKVPILDPQLKTLTLLEKNQRPFQIKNAFMLGYVCSQFMFWSESITKAI